MRKEKNVKMIELLLHDEELDEYDAFRKQYIGDLENESAFYTTIAQIPDGLNWYGYCGNYPMNFVDPTGLEFTTYTTPYTQNDNRWGNLPYGSTSNIANAGCNMTAAVNNVNALKDTNTNTPQTANTSTYVTTSTDPTTDGSFDYKKYVEDQGLNYNSVKNPSASTSSTWLSSLQNSPSEYGVSVRVPYDTAGKTHVVNVEGLKTIDNSTWVHVNPSSSHDLNPIDRTRSDWKFEDTVTYTRTCRTVTTDAYVKVSSITSIQVVSKCPGK